MDLKRGCLAVTRAKKRQKNDAESLAIVRELVGHLRAYLTWRACRLDSLKAKYRGSMTAKSGALFVGERGALGVQGLQRCWRRAVKLARLPAELSIHTARHTCATHLLHKTGNLRLVQEQLGHSSPTTTANMYADVTFEDMQAGVEGLYTSWSAWT